VLDAVRWAGPYPAQAKLSPRLNDAGASAYARRVAGRVELIVTLFPGASVAAVRTRLQALGADISAVVEPAGHLALTLPAGREQAVAADPGVQWVEPTLPPGSAESERARTFIGVDVGPVPAGRPDGSGVRVGVMEGSHAQLNHPDFGNRVTQADTGTLVPNFHTTMTMGMILGSGAQSLNQGAQAANQWRGVAPAATGLSYSFATSANSIADYIGDVTRAVQTGRVDLMNNSWGDSGCHNIAYGAYDGRAPFLDGVVRGSLGRPVTIVFSGGNERAGFFANNANDTSCIGSAAAPFANYATLNHPKAAKNVIAVGAADSANSHMTSYSSWGPTADGRLKPDVVAAGHHNGAAAAGITSINNAFGMPTGAANQQDYRTPIFDPNHVYGWFGQTSAAAAEVSGGLVLMIDGWRRAFPQRADPLPSTLRAALVHHAVDLDDPTTTWYRPGPDYASGYGVVRINDSVDALMRGDAVEGSVAHGASARYTLNLGANNGPLRITVAWDDEAAAVGASPAIVNDLDLVVIDPTGTRHFPWTLNPANPSAAAVRTAENHLDNLEQVLVDAPVAGTWAVEVRGTSVPSGRQNFSFITRNGAARQPADLVLALDTSDSMNSPAATGGQPKIEVLRRSVQLLLQTWSLHAVAADRVGVVTFSGDVATPGAPPVMQPLQANLGALLTTIGGLQASGCTALGGALQTAFGSLAPASANKRSILLVTDGMQSANPFVGETGSPASLSIQSLTGAAPMPFGAFFCTTTPANGPGGAPIVPDGQTVASHAIDIHTIGIGVNGAGFEALITRLASENRGLHHLTTTPDGDLDLLYINDLVRALRSNTLEVIRTDRGKLAPGVPRELRFPVNGTSRSVTAVLSWRDPGKAGAITTQMRGPGGVVLVPSAQRQGAFFSVLRFDLGGASAPGDWTLALLAGTQAPDYQLSLIADETCFHYDVVLPTRTVRAGEAVTFGATLSAGGRALAEPPGVQLVLNEPMRSHAELLAEFLPRTRAARALLAALRRGAWQKLGANGGAFEAALAELLRSRSFLDAARGSHTHELKLTPLVLPEGLTPELMGETRLNTNARVFDKPGVRSLTWQVAGASACGPLLRQETASLTVSLGRLDLDASQLRQRRGPLGAVLVSLRPADARGNLLGPGQASAIKIEAAGARPLTGVIDLLDGRYLRVFTPPEKGQKLVTQVQVLGETLVAGK
jgi:hypothetical protein